MKLKAEIRSKHTSIEYLAMIGTDTYAQL